jgi:hypothetical protein
MYCKKCAKRFRDRRALNIHINKIHSKSNIEKQLKSLEKGSIAKTYFAIVAEPGISNYELKKRISYYAGIDSYVKLLSDRELIKIQKKKVGERVKNECYAIQDIIPDFIFSYADRHLPANYTDDNVRKLETFVHAAILSAGFEGFIKEFGKGFEYDVDKCYLYFMSLGDSFREKIFMTSVLNFYKRFFNDPSLRMEDLDKKILNFTEKDVMNVLNFLKKEFSRLNKYILSALLTEIFYPFYQHISYKSCENLKSLYDDINGFAVSFNEKYSNENIEKDFYETYWKTTVEPSLEVLNNFLSHIKKLKERGKIEQAIEQLNGIMIRLPFDEKEIKKLKEDLENKSRV